MGKCDTRELRERKSLAAALAEVEGRGEESRRVQRAEEEEEEHKEEGEKHNDDDVAQNTGDEEYILFIYELGYAVE
eukprot:g11332.t1